jgi:hypothetical protein
MLSATMRTVSAIGAVGFSRSSHFLDRPPPNAVTRGFPATPASHAENNERQQTSLVI